MRARHLMGICFVLAGSGAWAVACGGSQTETPGEDVGMDSGSDDADSLLEDTTPPFEVGGVCTSSTECDGGVCIDGKCCGSLSAVCGSTCCAGGTVCLFDKCVTPGAACTSGNDCKPGEYCEPALGDKPTGDAGTDGGSDASDAKADAADAKLDATDAADAKGDAADAADVKVDAADGGDAGPTCVEPLPVKGRCLPRPPVCPSGDGGVDGGADGGDSGATDCVEKCEYHPPVVGKLDAVAKWTWGAGAKEYPTFIDVWSTPVIGRVHDANCDGKVDELDPPNVIFVSGDTEGTCCQCNGKVPTACHTGVLRMLNGRDGKEIWSLRKASATSSGFAGFTLALGDLDGDKRIDIAAVTGEGYIVLIDADGKVTATSDKPIPGAADDSFGWGGGLAIADMDGDGRPEIAFGSTLFTTSGGGVTLKWSKAAATSTDLSTFADVDGDGKLELVDGGNVYRYDGTSVWTRTDIGPNAFPAVADLDKDGKPEVILVRAGQMWIVNGLDGKTQLGPVAIPGTGSGGAPTVADFDGDKLPEIGVAMATYYSVLKPNYAKKTIDVLWKTPNHDLSSSVTGSSVFDFEGDGRAEVIYNDECFLWVYDGVTGAIRFTGLTSSFTATEASLVADVDGDGHAEMIMVSNSADPSATGWKCDTDPWNKPDPVTGRPAWKWSGTPTKPLPYRGLTVFGDRASSWVGTRTLWSEHTYHVSNICDDRDTACAAPATYGSIPKVEKKNWTVPWLNNFRQNVQDKGIFDAADATVSLAVSCSSPVVLEASLRNAGLAALPKGVAIGLYDVTAGGVLLGTVTSEISLFPGQTERITFSVPAAAASKTDTFVAKILYDAKSPYRQCRTDNDSSGEVRATCPK